MPADDHEIAARLADLEARHRSLIDHLPAVLYVDGVAAGASTIDVSPGIARLLGIAPEGWLAADVARDAHVHPDDRAHVAEQRRRAVGTGEPFRAEYRALHADGHVVWIREDAALVRDTSGEPLHWLGTMLDVTDLMSARDDLHAATTKYGALVEQIPAIVYQDVGDEALTTVYVSPQVHTILGVLPEEWVGDSKLWAEMLHPEDREETILAVDRGVRAGRPFSVEYRMVARDGRVVWFQDSAVMLPGADGRTEFIQGVMLDVTERKRAEERLSWVAYHDQVTGLPNKAMFDETLDLGLARARRTRHGVAVLALDIDDFKLVNDSLGHEAGDRVIGLLGDRLRVAVREMDIVARQGGDEFLLLVADVEPLGSGSGSDAAAQAAVSIAERVGRALRAPFVVDGTELYLTASIGIAVYPDDADDAGTLLRNADAAMFRAKATGPGAFARHEVDHVDAFSRLSLSTRLRKAVDQQDWTLHYQPLVDLASADMIGVEALIRWPDPTGGLVPPGEFIPLAEEMGLIEAIGAWVVDEICRQDAAWRAEGLELEISFNLSPRQLWHADPVETIARQLADAGMDPARLTVEITESAAMHDPDRIIDVLHRFKDRGFRLAIDDFGTGYSSLARLRSMPVDILKIDRAFIREVHTDPQSASMVSAIIALASNLHMEPLAEGIETIDEWRFLADRGCAYGQGFFFSRPVPAADILALYRHRGLRLVEGGLAS